MVLQAMAYLDAAIHCKGTTFQWRPLVNRCELDELRRIIAPFLSPYIELAFGEDDQRFELAAVACQPCCVY